LIQWLFVWGEPGITDARVFGGFITWAKVLGLFCLLGWVGTWIVRDLADPSWTKHWRRRLATLLGAIVFGLAGYLLQTLEATGQVRFVRLSGLTLPSICGVLAFALGLFFVESRLWSVIGARRGKSDRVLLILLHAMLGLGLLVSAFIPHEVRQSAIMIGTTLLAPLAPWQSWLIEGGKIGVTYMGLAVLAWTALTLIRDVSALRWRRLYSIAWHSVVESTRRMWAPWVVIAIFVVILAFTSWFLKPGGDRAAELSRLYTGTLMLVSAMLVTVMVVILSPISIPNDIRQQTIYTIVSKPVHRLELIWGRLLGFMALVTVLLLGFGAVSMFYLNRVVSKRIETTRAAAARAAEQNRPDFAKQLNDQADQLETRLSARVPVKGSLIFYDSKEKMRLKGIDVGSELESRSHIEGASPSKAVWRYGIVRDPFDTRRVLDRRIPVASLLRPETIEWYMDRAYTAADRIDSLKRQQAQPNISAQDSRKLAGQIQQLEQELESAQGSYRQLEQRDAQLRRQTLQARQSGQTRQEQQYAQQSAQLHSPPIPIEMTFNIYRTTKGEIGEAVLASMVVKNPRPGTAPHRSFFGVHEYYTTKQSIPARVIAGSQGFLDIEIRCETINQYLGMAESDLYILARQGSFWTNYLRGLLGVWLQALVIASIGLFLGTFLSWPVAFVSTIFFFIVGQIAMGTLQSFALRSIIGGGPLESLIRLLGHDNQMSELAPTLAVVLAKTFDQALMPFLSRLVYLIPNLNVLDVSNTVSEGFAVGPDILIGNVLLGLGYAIPFTIAGYYILKSREVAA
jgi:ABC-type transport system involved in multi-copper enzyme maturation permease subunit